MKSKISIICILIPLFTSFLYSQNVKVLSSDKNALIFEYTPQIDTAHIQINGTEYIKFDLIGGSFNNDENSGAPLIPVMTVLVGVPAETGNTFQILSSSYSDYSGKPLPAYNQTKSEYMVADAYSQYQNSELLELADFNTIRSIPVQRIILNPVQANVAQNKIRVYNKITVKVTFNKNQNFSNTLTDDLFSGIIVNYDVAKKWSTLETKLNKAAINSVLAAGTWKKFEAPVEGIYKIDKQTLASAGFDVNSIDPRTIKIYNNGGKVLPESYLVNRPIDLEENAVFFNGNDDAVFDDGEYILFYGRGIDFWEYDTQTSKIARYHHPYSKVNYFWITAGGEASKRMQVITSSDAAPEHTQTQSDAFIGYEDDILNKFGTGRMYVGDEFANTTKSRVYTNKLEGYVENSAIKYNYSFYGVSANYSVPFQLHEGDNLFYSTSIQKLSADYLATESLKTDFTITYSGGLTDKRSNLKLTYNATDGSAFGYLDYFEIKYKRNLETETDNMLFYSENPSSLTEYRMNGFSNSNILVFDLSDYTNVKYIDNLQKNSGECSFTVQEPARLSKYLAITSEQFLTPANFVSAENSNLRGEQTGAQLIIITPNAFKTQAERLKAYRESQSPNKLSVYIAVIDDIFDEFSGGLKDVTGIRDFISYAFKNWSIKPEYVLLFGDGDYDYKGTTGTNVNYVIPYETKLSIHDMSSYPTDDFYTSLKNTYDSVPSTGGSLNLDLAVGRINAQSESDISNYIDKIIAYENADNGSLWKNSIAFVSDDMYQNGDEETINFTNDSENLSKLIPNSFNITKIYSPAFPTQKAAFGTRRPDVNKEIIKSINDGVLLLNFYGHGNPTIWTDEHIFENSTTIPKLTNEHYFFLCATTCSFGFYDDPYVQSGSELLILKPKSGSIFNIAATKSVWSNNAISFNRNILKNIFDKNGYSVGKAVLLNKLTSNIEDTRKFHIYGDPTIHLNYPKGKSRIDSVNGISINSTAHIKALSSVKVDGSVLTSDGDLNASFNGECILSVYEAEKTKTLDLTEIQTQKVAEQGGVIFKGRSTVTNGKFSVEFVTPKDISYDTTKNGKIVAYFYNSSEEGVGVTTNVKIGGIDTTLTNDGKGPELDIYFNNFSDGGSNLVNRNFNLLIKLADESGLNTTGSGIGHKIEAILNDDVNNPIDLTDYYISDLNSGGKSGKINYSFIDLEPGNYKIQVKAWDIFNNVSIAERTFMVADDGEISIRNLLNYPNPFSSSTMFTFQHNISQPIDVKIKIYSVAGRLIQQIEKNNILEKFVKIDWNGRDRDGNDIGNGAYIYKVIIKSADGMYSKSSIGKLAIVK